MKIPYQVNDGAILAVLPNGQVEFLEHRVRGVIEAINQGLIPWESVDFRPFIVRSPAVQLENFHLTAPAIVFVETTNLCNLRCKHCYVSSGYRRPNEMPTEVLLRVLDELAEMGVLQIFLTGGELFAHKDAVRIIQHALTKPFVTQIFTNATLITEEKLAQLPPGTSFNVSFDTADPVRTVRGGMDFPKLRQVFEWMKKYGHVFRTAISVHRYNIKDAPEIFRWCLENGYPRPQWLETHPLGRTLLHPDILIQPEQVAEVFEAYTQCMDLYSEPPGDEYWAPEQGPNGRVPIYSIDTIRFAVRLEYATGQEKCGRSLAYINAAGDVYPCSNCQSAYMYRAGNVRERSFREIWEHGFQDWRRITFADFAVCRECPVQQASIWCQFRCPPLSRNLNGTETGCGATEYLRRFMLLTDAYWKEHARQGKRLVLTRQSKR
jgi:radical SAM protein with 4Fe4S-binding SPASM domain